MRIHTILIILLLSTLTITLGVVQAQEDSSDSSSNSVNEIETEESTAAQEAALFEQLDTVQTLDKLPPYILLVARRTVPGAEFSGFQWDLSDNLRPFYELQGMQDNKQLEIGVFLDGSINRINRTITMSDVPVDVIGMLDKYVRDFEVDNVNEATLASGVHRFEFSGTSGNVNLAVEISDSANQIRIVESQ